MCVYTLLTQGMVDCTYSNNNAGELGALWLTQLNEYKSQSGTSGLAIQTYEYLLLKFHNFWHSSQAKLKPGLPICHFIKGFDVFWELCLKCSCFGYIIAFQLGYKVYQVGIVKSFQLKPCRTICARFDAANLEPAPILKTSSVCVCMCVCGLPHFSIAICEYLTNMWQHHQGQLRLGQVPSTHPLAVWPWLSVSSRE